MQWCLGDFTVRESLCDGPYGSVCAAEVRRSGRRVVLKKRIARQREKAEREWAFFTHLPRHEHLVRCLGSFTAFGASRYIVLDFARGGDLKQMINARAERRAPLAEAVVWGIMKQIASGVAHLHRNGVCHGDLKPANILLQEEGGGDWHGGYGDAVVKLCDLDAAQWINPPRAAPITASGGSSGFVVGSLAYAAPEVVAGFCKRSRCLFPSRRFTKPGGAQAPTLLTQGRLITHAATNVRRIDIWSMGATLFELVHLVQLFKAPSRALLFEQIVIDPLTRLRDVAPAASPESPWSSKVEGMLTRLIVRDPAERPTAAGIYRWFGGSASSSAADGEASVPQSPPPATTKSSGASATSVGGGSNAALAQVGRGGEEAAATDSPDGDEKPAAKSDSPPPSAALRQRRRRRRVPGAAASKASDSSLLTGPDVRLRPMAANRMTREGAEIALKKLMATTEGAVEYDPITLAWKTRSLKKETRADRLRVGEEEEEREKLKLMQG